MVFKIHAIFRMRERGIPLSDAEAVVKNPTKSLPGYNGSTNLWGIGPKSGYRIRVTLDRNRLVATVAWADPRKGEKRDD